VHVPPPDKVKLESREPRKAVLYDVFVNVVAKSERLSF
jgi:hypothetical protein